MGGYDRPGKQAAHASEDSSCHPRGWNVVFFRVIQYSPQAEDRAYSKKCTFEPFMKMQTPSRRLSSLRFGALGACVDSLIATSQYSKMMCSGLLGAFY